MRPGDLISAHESLRADYEAGRISYDGLVKACADLMVEGADGRWWTVDATGRVLAYDATRQEWIATPPPADETKTPAVKTPAAKMKAHGPKTGEPETHESKAGEKRARAHAAVPTEVAPAIAPLIGALPVARADGLAAPVRVAGTKPAQSRGPAKSAPGIAPATDVPPPSPAASGQSTAVMFAAVFGASFALSWVGWDILGIVPQAINAVIPTGRCTSFAPASMGMYFCSALVGLRVVFGSLVLAVAMLILRKPITGIVNLINRAVPAAFRTVLPAVVAAAFFAVVWSGSHASTGGLWGILPHRAFPALVGVLVQATMVWGPGFMTRHATFFGLRDRLPKLFRWLLVILVPMAVSLFITAEQRVSNEAFKQQFVVLVGMIAAFVIMTPRSGKLSDLRAELGGDPEAAKADGRKG